MAKEVYTPPVVISDDDGIQPMAFIFPVLVAAGIFYTVGAVVQLAIVMETAVGLAAVAAVGAVTFVGSGETCN